MGRVDAVRLPVYAQPEWIAGPFERASPMPVHGRSGKEIAKAVSLAGDEKARKPQVPARSLRCANLMLRFARGPVLEQLDRKVPFMDSRGSRPRMASISTASVNERSNRQCPHLLQPEGLNDRSRGHRPRMEGPR
jgi:hypothetical protein